MEPVEIYEQCTESVKKAIILARDARYKEGFLMTVINALEDLKSMAPRVNRPKDVQTIDELLAEFNKKLSHSAEAEIKPFKLDELLLNSTGGEYNDGEGDGGGRY